MAAVEFGRTESGKANKPYFVGKVIFYVEGDDDIAFFAPLRRLLDARFESANGKNEALKLASREDGAKYPYVVILDDDFDRLLDKHISKSNVVYVGRYSIENLVARDDLLIDFVRDYCGTEDDVPEIYLMAKVWQDCGERLVRLVVADLAACISGSGRGGVPDRIEAWIEVVGERIRIRDAAWRRFEEYVRGLDGAALSRAESLLHGRESGDVCEHHLRGHLIFGLLRNRLIHAIRQIRGSGFAADSRVILRMFSEMFWRSEGCSERLRDSLLQAKQGAAALL